MGKDVGTGYIEDNLGRGAITLIKPTFPCNRLRSVWDCSHCPVVLWCLVLSLLSDLLSLLLRVWIQFQVLDICFLKNLEEYFRKHLKESVFYTPGSKLLIPFGPRTSLTLHESLHVTMKANNELTVVTLSRLSPFSNIPESVILTGYVWQTARYDCSSSLIQSSIKRQLLDCFLFIDVELLTVY